MQPGSLACLWHGPRSSSQIERSLRGSPKIKNEKIFKNFESGITKKEKIRYKFSFLQLLYRY